MNERRPRSQIYQSLFAERLVASEFLESFSNDEGIYKRLAPFDYNDQIADLEEQLRKEFWRIVEELTPRQRQVLRLYADGYTQMEIAKVLGINQSSCVKSMRGNCQYSNEGKISYGGSFRKLKKVIETDERIIDILQKIAALRDESWI